MHLLCAGKAELRRPVDVGLRVLQLDAGGTSANQEREHYLGNIT